MPAPGSGRPAIERIQARCTYEDHGYFSLCCVWKGALNRDGYGYISLPKRKNARIHRHVWEHFNGPIPAGMQLDHLCRQRDCCEPTHLEVVTPRENTLRSPTSPSALNARKTHCIHDHPLSGDNLYRRSDGVRICKSCRRVRQRNRRHRQRAALCST